jgi:hypothetical protein
MDINANAPALTRDEIPIYAPPSVIWQIQTNISGWPRPRTVLSCGADLQ